MGNQNLTDTNLQQLMLIQDNEEDGLNENVEVSSVSDSESDSGSESSPDTAEISS